MKRIYCDYLDLNVEIKKSFYPDGDLALLLYTADTQSYLATITHHFTDIVKNEQAFLNTISYPWVTKMLKNFGSYEHKEKKCGSCKYPLWHFQTSFLEECNVVKKEFL